MRALKLLSGVFCLAIGWSPANAEEMSYGEAEFLNSCAVCHGVEGKGDGALGDELMKRPADLTRISERNGGTFPYARVFAVIDGRYVVPGHGEREMPVWGRQFLVDDTDLYGPAGGEIVTTERIHELTGYVQSLQRR
jgi:mono/diheme cytochrome c family protein